MSLNSNAFFDRIRAAINLPACSAANREFAPELAYGRHSGPPPVNARRSAVLVLLFPEADDWHVVLSVRQTHLSAHAGQIGFPGGKIEAGEGSHTAAVREYREEVGPLAEFETLGRLPNTYIYASDFVVEPWVAVVPERPVFRPDPAETADVLTPTLADLADRSRYGSHEIVRGSLRFRVPHCRTQGRLLWGATFLILTDFMRRLESLGPLRSAA